jgi:SAM-dependent methyltransferase
MNDLHEQIVAGYDATAKEFAQDAELLHAKYGGEARDYFATNLANGRRLLEIGAGAGQEAKWFAKHGARVLAVDPSTELVRVAGKEPGDVTFRVGTIETVAAADGPFDGLWCNRVFQHLTPEARLPFLMKAASLLAPDGLFYLSARVSDLEPEPGVGQFIPKFDVSEKNLHNLLDCAGWRIEKESAWEDVPPWREYFLRRRPDKLNCDLNVGAR